MTIGGIPLDLLDKFGALAIIVIGAVMVITEKLVWHKRLEKAEARVERLEQMLWDSILVSSKTVGTAEVTTDLVQSLPNLAEGSP